ncbi:PAPA-1-like conserved region-domain-containing protein [Ephemerocybe angulata]|uniref:PAPA-1-like conserved region-domain-containing protein n=1 Tax=Ephemerocybe angulata TaxID=980116 RepID=A0A8H6HZ90_9AGAR|nr:PAPA-1-like conserved region-domain-containing protein [Tulosesus angulatus]
MVDSSHVSLDGAAIPGSGAGGRRKKQLTEMEMKLRREETARKRKNLSEKKLEDEKAETINRLLKKQTRPRARRTNTTDSEGDGEEWEDEGVRDEPKPTWVRWVSRVVTVPEAPAGADSMEVDGAAVKALEKRMVLSLSLPSALVQLVEAGKAGGGEAMDVDGGAGRAPRVEQRCAVEGCGERRKYRLVRDWTRGACGMGHLKILEGMV